MIRDIIYYYPRNIYDTYNAYWSSAVNRMGRSCKIEKYHTIAFGLSYSFTYNMNGGACNIHFIPYQGGTAVNIHFSIVQAFGANFKKYDRDLTGYASSMLGVMPSVLNIPPSTFMLEQYKVYETPAQNGTQYPQQSRNPQQYSGQPAQNGTQYPQQSRNPQQYSGQPTQNGTQYPQQSQSPQQYSGQPAQNSTQHPQQSPKQIPVTGTVFCPQCGTNNAGDSSFCFSCGQRLK